jgi:precorrin-2 dehydrogenase/sirohydrochlorin ferrochelatase
MFYPLFIELLDRPVLVVGGGAVAERKVQSLLEAGADITLVAPDVTQELQRLAKNKAIRIHQRRFEEMDVERALLVITATDDAQIQNRAVAAARSRGIPVNTVDQPALCDFIVPAVVRHGDVIVAISTSGKSPALAAALRGKVESVITPDAARAARILGEIRTEVHHRFPDPERRKQVFQEIVNSGILDWISQCDDAAALQRVRGILEKIR